ncbi:hypothetical protein AYO41_04770 [Verrucomicrobia bacterium SCGC AG-212-E04]|nr:hypothetical protein AYO41_04770 [Verrucomicrobia bacterium SCGC AG-212-E04]
MEPLRYLPTNDELLDSAVPPAERKRRAVERNRPKDKIYVEAARILLARGHDPGTCPVWFAHEAYAEAKARLTPDPLIS